MKIFLCRHGQTTGDVEDRYGGDYDDHLTDLGKSQAEELAQKLQGKGIERIFSSPKIRTTETADILSKSLVCEVETIPDLRERNQNGILTGMIRAEAREKYPDLVKRVKDYLNTIEGAEDYASFSKRVHESLLEIAKKDYKVLAIVTHGGPIKAILRKIKYAFDYKIADCAFAEVQIVDGQIKLVSLNKVILCLQRSL